MKIVKTITDDNRSYHISSKKLKIFWVLKHNLRSKMVRDLRKLLKKVFEDTLNNDLYFNIKRMNKLNLK